MKNKTNKRIFKGNLFKGNLHKIEKIADELEADAGKCWDKADRLRDLAVDRLGNVNQMVLEELKANEAERKGYERAVKRIRELLEEKKVK